jgi:DNA polymerase III delta subunit
LEQAQLQEYAGGQGLFESKYIVFLDRLCEDKKIKEDFLDFIKELGESQNIFIILEGKLDKATAGKIEKKAEKTQEFLLPEKKKEEYNAFALANAVGNRDKKNAWILYRKAIDKGEAPEALHGMMFWKVKSMMIGGLGNAYSKEELYNLADRLITTYHDSRRGVHELETGVEALILSL